MAFRDYIDRVVNRAVLALGMPAARQLERGKIAEDIAEPGFASLYEQLEKLPGKDRDAEWRAAQAEDRLFMTGAIMEDDLMDDLGVDIWRIILSGAVLRKIKTKRGEEVKARDFLMLQRIVDGDKIYHQKKEKDKGKDTHRVGFAQDDEGKWWRAIWKRTLNGKEVYFTTFHPYEARKIKKIEKKYDVKVKREKK